MIFQEKSTCKNENSTCKNKKSTCKWKKSTCFLSRVFFFSSSRTRRRRNFWKIYLKNGFSGEKVLVKNKNSTCTSVSKKVLSHTKKYLHIPTNCGKSEKIVLAHGASTRGIDRRGDLTRHSSVLFFSYWTGPVRVCLLFTSDAADERSSVDLGGRSLINTKHITANQRVLYERQLTTPTKAWN